MPDKVKVVCEDCGGSTVDCYGEECVGCLGRGWEFKNPEDLNPDDDVIKNGEQLRTWLPPV